MWQDWRGGAHLAGPRARKRAVAGRACAGIGWRRAWLGVQLQVTPDRRPASDAASSLMSHAYDMLTWPRVQGALIMLASPLHPHKTLNELSKLNGELRVVHRSSHTAALQLTTAALRQRLAAHTHTSPRLLRSLGHYSQP